MRDFVTFEPLGRLGNLLFQYAACIGYAKKYDADAFLPPHYHHRDIYRCWPKLPKYRGNIRRLPVYDVALDETWHYNEIPKHPGGVKIRGFFQSLKHFDNAIPEVKAAFPLAINPIDFVSLHVRRGDYLDTNQGTFCPIDMNYITLAIQYFKERGKTRFMVVSDDLPWCKQNIKDPDCDIQFSDGRSVFHDLSLMASCTNHIMSNSTLAWWGAFLGHNENKMVVTPSAEPPNWFLNGRMNTKDLLPPEWHQIKYR